MRRKTAKKVFGICMALMLAASGACFAACGDFFTQEDVFSAQHIITSSVAWAFSEAETGKDSSVSFRAKLFDNTDCPYLYAYSGSKLGVYAFFCRDEAEADEIASGKGLSFNPEGLVVSRKNKVVLFELRENFYRDTIAKAEMKAVSYVKDARKAAYEKLVEESISALNVACKYLHVQLSSKTRETVKIEEADGYVGSRTWQTEKGIATVAGETEAKTWREKQTSIGKKYDAESYVDLEKEEGFVYYELKETL